MSIKRGNKLKNLIILTLLFLIPQLSMAAGLVNDMQGCQGVIQFVDKKLDTAPDRYGPKEVTTVRQGLQAYNDYIQSDIVTPGLLKFTSGDQAKATVLQNQVDTYIGTVVSQLNTRYPQNRLFTDHAILINNCAKKAVPSGQDLDALKQALQTMIELAKLN